MSEISAIGSFRVRVGYSKLGRLRYLGHLEVAHTLERVVRRANLPYAITQGFSPRMRIAYSAAVPCGTASEDEWFDLWLEEYIPANEILDRLVASSPHDLMPTCAGYVDMHNPALTAELTRAQYRVTITARAQACATSAPMSFDTFTAAFDACAANEFIEYARGAKTKRMNVANTLVDYQLSQLDEGVFEVILNTRSSNAGALRPEVLINEVENSLGAQIQKELFVHCEIDKISQFIEHEDGTLSKPLTHPRESEVKFKATSCQ